MVTPRMPCELMFCPVMKRFGTFVRCDTKVCVGKFLSRMMPYIDPYWVAV